MMHNQWSVDFQACGDSPTIRTSYQMNNLDYCGRIEQRTWIHYPSVHWRRLRWWIRQAELSLNLQAGRTIPTHQSPQIEPCPLGESGSPGKMVLVGGKVHDGMAIVGDGIDAGNLVLFWVMIGQVMAGQIDVLQLTVIHKNKAPTGTRGGKVKQSKLTVGVGFSRKSIRLRETAAPPISPKGNDFLPRPFQLSSPTTRACCLSSSSSSSSSLLSSLFLFPFPISRFSPWLSSPLWIVSITLTPSSSSFFFFLSIRLFSPPPSAHPFPSSFSAFPLLVFCFLFSLSLPLSPPHFLDLILGHTFTINTFFAFSLCW